jgi:hypothetical protein
MYVYISHAHACICYSLSLSLSLSLSPASVLHATAIHNKQRCPHYLLQHACMIYIVFLYICMYHHRSYVRTTPAIVQMTEFNTQACISLSPEWFAYCDQNYRNYFGWKRKEKGRRKRSPTPPHNPTYPLTFVCANKFISFGIEKLHKFICFKKLIRPFFIKSYQQKAFCKNHMHTSHNAQLSSN